MSVPSAAIRFGCPQCKGPLIAQPEQGGTTVACPRCKARMIVPRPGSTALPPGVTITFRGRAVAEGRLEGDAVTWSGDEAIVGPVVDSFRTRFGDGTALLAALLARLKGDLRAEPLGDPASWAPQLKEGIVENDAGSVSLKGIEDAESKGFFALAAELARRYVQTCPDDPEGAFLLGRSFANLKLYVEARRTLESVLSRCSEAARPDVLAQVAEVCSKSGRVADAVRYYSEAVAAAPGVADNHLTLAALLQAEGRHAEAEQCLRQGIADCPVATRPKELFLALGEVLCAKNALEESRAVFQRVFDLDPDDEEAHLAVKDIEEVAKLRGLALSPSVATDAAGLETHLEPRQITANIKGEWFKEIAAGRKKVEYRDSSDHWRKKLDQAGEPPFHLRLINGMRKQAPELTVVVEQVLLDIWNGQYQLHLGEVIDLQNWDRNREAPA